MVGTAAASADEPADGEANLTAVRGAADAFSTSANKLAAVVAAAEDHGYLQFDADQLKAKAKKFAASAAAADTVDELIEEFERLQTQIEALVELYEEVSPNHTPNFKVKNAVSGMVAKYNTLHMAIWGVPAPPI